MAISAIIASAAQRGFFACVTGRPRAGSSTNRRRVPIATARSHGMMVMAGCMIESSLGITAAAHFAPLLDYADFDGAALLSDGTARCWGLNDYGQIGNPTSSTYARGPTAKRWCSSGPSRVHARRFRPRPTVASTRVARRPGAGSSWTTGTITDPGT